MFFLYNLYVVNCVVTVVKWQNYSYMIKCWYNINLHSSIENNYSQRKSKLGWWRGMHPQHPQWCIRTWFWLVDLYWVIQYMILGNSTQTTEIYSICCYVLNLWRTVVSPIFDCLADWHFFNCPLKLSNETFDFVSAKKCWNNCEIIWHFVSSSRTSSSRIVTVELEPAVSCQPAHPRLYQSPCRPNPAHTGCRLEF